jgi:glycosyltransferase involved in cell wall biosynthesis
VLIEAGLAGLPVVTTNVSGASTVVEHGRSGYVVPVHDLDAMVDAAEHLVVDRALRSEMGAAGRERCVREFSLASEARRWREMLDGLAPLPSEAPSPGGR